MNTFIKDFSDNLLFDFLNNECNIENDYFILNYNVYKKNAILIITILTILTII